MDIKIRCPHCETKLIVGDDLVGQSVLCEECDKQFTVEKPAGTSKSGEKPRPRDDDRPSRRRRDEDAEDEKPRSRPPRESFDDEDDRPVRRKPKRSSSNLAPMIFGSLLVVMTLLVGVGLFFAFGFGTSGGGGGGGAVPAGGKFRLLNPQGMPNGGFTVVVETVDGRPPPPGRYQVTWQSPDGMSKGNATLVMVGSRTTYSNPGWGGFGRRQSFNIWIDYEPPSGTKLSNVVTVY